MTSALPSSHHLSIFILQADGKNVNSIVIMQSKIKEMSAVQIWDLCTFFDSTLDNLTVPIHKGCIILYQIAECCSSSEARNFRHKSDMSTKIVRSAFLRNSCLLLFLFRFLNLRKSCLLFLFFS